MDVRQTLEFPKRSTDDGKQNIPSYSRKFVSAEARARLEHLVAPHVDSFDYFLESGLRAAVQDLPAYELKVGVWVVFHTTCCDGALHHLRREEDAWCPSHLSFAPVATRSWATTCWCGYGTRRHRCVVVWLGRRVYVQLALTSRDPNLRWATP